jgi:hypothetical protein
MEPIIPSAALGRLSRSGKSRQLIRDNFLKPRLPNAKNYYLVHVQQLSEPNAAGWALARCPFHDDHTPSLGVNLTHGGFICHGCGTSGGDVLAFHQKKYGLSFKKAVAALAAWKVVTK